MTWIEPVDRGQLSPDQERIFRRFEEGPWHALRPTMAPFLHDPDFVESLEPLATYFRFRCKLPDPLREIAILMVAQHRKADHIWHAHDAHAFEAGLSRETIHAIGQGNTPKYEDQAQLLTHHYCREFLSPNSVSKQMFDEANGLLGNTGVIELAGLLGFYVMWAMILASIGVKAPPDAEIPWKKPA